MVAVGGALAGTGVRAQGGPGSGQVRRTPRFETAVGWLWTGQSDLGGRSASLTPNLGGSPVSLFDVRASVAAPLGGEVRFGYRVWHWLVASVTGEVSRGDVTVDVTSDYEGAPALSFAGEQLGQASVSARADVLLPSWRRGSVRVTPHVAASAGVCRQWHEGRTVIQHGQVYGAGAGVRLTRTSTPGAGPPRFGVLAEARLVTVRGGFNWGRASRPAPAAVVEVFAGWGR